MTCTSNLARILQERGMTGAQLSRQCGMNPKNFCTLISAKRLPNHDTAARIAVALGLSVTDIWPNHEAEMSERRKRITTRLLEWHAAHCDDPDYYPRKSRPKRAKNPACPSAQPAYKQARQVESEMRKTQALRADEPNPYAPNAIPVPLEMHANPFRLMPAHVDVDMLQDATYCRGQAARIAKWLYDHLAYGVYRELRELMVRENSAWEERERNAAKMPREEASL